LIRHTARWINPESQHQFDMTPTRTWQNTAGRYCPEYTVATVIGGRQQQSQGTACMQPDGNWQIVS
jgi:surface antigen